MMMGLRCSSSSLLITVFPFVQLITKIMGPDDGCCILLLSKAVLISMMSSLSKSVCFCGMVCYKLFSVLLLLWRDVLLYHLVSPLAFLIFLVFLHFYNAWTDLSATIAIDDYDKKSCWI